MTKPWDERWYVEYESGDAISVKAEGSLYEVHYSGGGQYDRAHLIAAAPAMARLLCRLEWVPRGYDDTPSCPDCVQPTGHHAPDCALYGASASGDAAVSGCTSTATPSADQCQVTSTTECDDSSGHSTLKVQITWSHDGSSGSGVMTAIFPTCSASYDVTYRKQ